MRAFLLACLAAGCLKANGYECASDTACVHGGVQGTCEAVHYCSFPDATCTSGRRFGDASGGYADQCVGGDGAPDGGTSMLDASATDAAPSDAAVVPDGPGCPANYMPVPGVSDRVYRKVPTGLWTAARTDCHNDGANTYLAIPADANHVQALRTFMGADFWIGISDAQTEGTYLTVLGAPATYLPWAAGQPDNGGNSDCVAVITGNQYDDRKCTTILPAVCECAP